MLAKSEILSSKIENNDRLVLDQKAKCGEQFDCHAHLNFHAKILQSVSIETLSEGEDVLHQRRLLYLWGPN